jgi:hypothetical protein
MLPSRIPLWLKLGWTAWIVVWAPFYFFHYGPQNFLWFCDLGNFLIMIGLWAESPLFLSWQACSVLLVQILFTIDLLVRAVAGFHPIGGTGYMFNDDGLNLPLGMRVLSLFHVVTPPVLLWALRRLGYDRRGLVAQVATDWIVLPICWLGWSEKVNLNWVWGPFDRPQYVVQPPWLYLIVCLVAYPLILSLPAHLVLSRLFRRPAVPDSL